MSPAPKLKKDSPAAAVATAVDEQKKRRKPVPVGRLYWSISDVEEMTGVKSHVLRYWETEFPALKPRKNSAGNRQYREKDIDLAILIKHLLYDELYTIKGARKKLSSTKKVSEIQGQFEIPFGTADQRQALREIRAELVSLRDLLGKL